MISNVSGFFRVCNAIIKTILVYCEPQPVNKKSTRSKKNKKDSRNKDVEKARNENYSGELSEKKKELLRVAKKYRITDLISR